MQAYSSSRSVAVVNDSWQMIDVRRRHRSPSRLQRSITGRIAAGSTASSGPIRRAAISST